MIEKKQSLGMSFGTESYIFDSNSVYAFGAGNLPASFNVQSGIEVILVKMKPGISCLFHNDDAHLSANKQFDISDMDQATRDLNEKLANAESLGLRWQLIQEYLLRKFRLDLPDKYGATARAINILYQNQVISLWKSLTNRYLPATGT
ncbi:MAG: hypothetical protein BGO88_03185 [Flavobacterium sp. 38-13]|nr:MAG: hypothetical protein BGO88_03185 [Flavobacterium sp. 38-13]